MRLGVSTDFGARCCVNVVGATSGPRWDGAVKDNFSKDAYDYRAFAWGQ